MKIAYIATLLVIGFMFGCNGQQKAKQDKLEYIAVLNSQVQTLTKQIQNLNQERTTLYGEVDVPKKIEKSQLYLAAVQSQVADLQAERDRIYGHLNTAKNIEQADMLRQRLRADIAVLEKQKQALVPKLYMVQFKLKQSNLTLDIGTHIKNGINAVEFEMPVDKSLYDSLSIGQDIMKDFRMGSFLIVGSIGNWKISVVNKYVKQKG